MLSRSTEILVLIQQESYRDSNVRPATDCHGILFGKVLMILSRKIHIIVKAYKREVEELNNGEEICKGET